MGRFAIVAALMLAGVRAAHAETYAIIDVKSKESLAAVDGKPRVGGLPGKANDWDLAPNWGKPHKIQVVSPRRDKGRYLAYDPQGKNEGHVYLSPGRGDGTLWLVRKVKAGSAQYTIQATSGKVKGWYLAPGGKGVHLVEKPESPPKWTIYDIAP